MSKKHCKIKLINTHQAKTQLSKMLKEVEEKNVVYRICRNGKSVAELRKAVDSVNPLLTHSEIFKIEFLEDPIEPLEEEDWPLKQR